MVRCLFPRPRGGSSTEQQAEHAQEFADAPPPQWIELMRRLEAENVRVLVSHLVAFSLVCRWVGRGEQKEERDSDLEFFLTQGGK